MCPLRFHRADWARVARVSLGCSWLSCCKASLPCAARSILHAFFPWHEWHQRLQQSATQLRHPTSSQSTDTKPSIHGVHLAEWALLIYSKQINLKNHIPTLRLVRVMDLALVHEVSGTLRDVLGLSVCHQVRVRPNMQVQRVVGCRLHDDELLEAWGLYSQQVDSAGGLPYRSAPEVHERACTPLIRSFDKPPACNAGRQPTRARGRESYVSTLSGTT